MLVGEVRWSDRCLWREMYVGGDVGWVETGGELIVLPAEGSKPPLPEVES